MTEAIRQSIIAMNRQERALDAEIDKLVAALTHVLLESKALRAKIATAKKESA